MKCKLCGNQTSFPPEQTRSAEQDDRAKAGWCLPCWRKKDLHHYSRDEIKRIKALQAKSAEQAQIRNKIHLDELVKGGREFAEWKCVKCGRTTNTNTREKAAAEKNERARAGLCKDCADGKEFIRCPECGSVVRENPRRCPTCNLDLWAL